MTHRIVSRFPLSLWVLGAAVLTLGLLLVYASDRTQVGSFILGPALLAFLTVGALVASHQPGNPLGWVFCVAALMGAAYLFATGYALEAFVAGHGSLPGAVWFAWMASWAGKFGFALLFMLTLLLFPDGRLPSPRWRPAAWLSVGWLAFITAATMLMPGTMNELYPSVRNPLGLESAAEVLDLILKVGNPSLVLVASLPAAALIVRFRRAGREQRQQLKWVALASSLLLVWAVCEVTLLPYPQFQPATNVLLTIALIALPGAIGIAILRHRLFDIDVIIRRTLVYSLLSALLAPAYFGSVVILQTVFRTLTGETSQIAIVVSTLAIAVLFFPVRQRVQAFIDRRFYRRKYDAATTLARFAMAARDETDLDALAEQLVEVMEETMQPESVALWLKPTESGKSPSLP